MDIQFQFICGVCHKANFLSDKAFFAHVDTYPDRKKNKFLCLQQHCYKELGDMHTFKKHINNHIKRGIVLYLHYIFNNLNRFFEGHRSNLIMEQLIDMADLHQDNNERVVGEDINLDYDYDQEQRIENDILLDDENAETIIDIDVNEVNNLDEYIFKIAASMYGATNLTIKYAMEIMKMLKDFSKMTVEFCLDRISNCNDLEEAKFKLSLNNIINFDDYLTEHKFKKALIQNDLYREPSKFTVSNEAVETHPGQFKNIEHQGVMMAVEFQIRKFLEIEKVVDSMLDYQKELAELPPGVYSNFVNGSYWKSILEKYPDKDLIPLFFYNDDFQVDTPVGPHSGVNALSPFYYLFPTLPPYMYSKLDHIFTCLITKAKDMKMFGNDSPLYAIVHKFQKLERNGILLHEGKPNERRVYIVSCKVLGDNLGLHASCGYRQAFNIGRPCITCEMVLEDLRVTCVENAELIRTIDKYEAYFEENTYEAYGVEKRCVLNTLPSFHVSLNRIVDFMHDVSLGVSKFSMQYALSYFISTYPRFTLKALNERIKSFDYGGKERGNKPPFVQNSHLQSNLQMNANESSFFLRYFPLLAKNLIPFCDPVYQWILETIDMVEFLGRTTFNEEDVEVLDELISRNRNTNVKAKRP